jgi:hypothetical protein
MNLSDKNEEIKEGVGNVDLNWLEPF